MKDIPVLHVRGETIAEGYENAIYALMKQGCEIKTQYDKPGDPLSKDCTLNLVVDSPDEDPMIHKAFPGGMADLREYVYELHGAKDEWVKNVNVDSDTRWEYTYHGRLTRYGAWKCIPDYSGSVVPKGCWTDGHQNGDLQNIDNTRTYRCGINQIDWVVEKLSKQPFTRQAQMITWMPNWDLYCYDPPCLQSIWLRITEDDICNQWLNTNIRFRSNDAWSASFFNMFGIMRLVKTIADSIAEKTGKPLNLGRLNWQADSYHIYGKDINSCQKMLIDKIDAKLPFEKRTMNFYDDYVQEMYTECEPMILQKIKNTEANFK